ncbi:hypothetical protein [Siphonobacter sp. SORGH_AS_0500]|uniref:hypothetical protein n=1 Tax=Siphonobacter sp. SORGH_AS_0500 TaxID=1864824 RepID=UPI00286D412E|nr:hypothetical protein [Siphonobacter sp. SORGH_AS_0500]
MESSNQFPENKPVTLEELQAEYEQQKVQIEARLQQEAQELRTKNINRRNECISKAETLRQLARETKDPETAVNYVNEAKTAEAEAALLASNLGIIIPEAPEEMQEEESTSLLSTTKGIWGLIAWVIGTAILFWMVGTSLVQSEDNDSASRMMNSVGLRLITNILPFALTFLAVIVTLKLLFPDQYRYWNNRLQSPFSLQNDLQQVEPWQRIAFFSFSVALPAWVFTMLMQVIFG